MTDTSLRSTQTVVNAAVAGSLAALLVWLGPPGTDLAGARLPARRLRPPRLLALDELLVRRPLHASSATASSTTRSRRSSGSSCSPCSASTAAAAAFTLVTAQAWGESTVWATRCFAVVAAASVLTAAFPYGLGLALALVALVALARRRLVAFSAARRAHLRREPARLPVPARRARRRSASRAAGARSRSRRSRSPRSICLVGLLLWRLFPDHGRYPFATERAARRARLLRARRSP